MLTAASELSSPHDQFRSELQRQKRISSTTLRRLKADQERKSIDPVPVSALPDLTPSDVVGFDCRQPKFSGQSVLIDSGIYNLDPENQLLIFHDVLNPADLALYLNEATQVPRTSTRSGFGIKPRREICYSPDGSPYKYSGVNHPTREYPQHVLTVMRQFETLINQELAKTSTPLSNPYTVPSSAVDICYNQEFPRGGSISRHKDDEDEWGMVVIFSLGQTRYLRVRADETGKWWNVKVIHNSLVVMFGPTFQKKYTHQVDKLYEDEPIGVRLSLNIRYKTPE